MGAGQSTSSISKGELHQLKLAKDRVAFRRNVNKLGDSDYDDEDDSMVDAVEDEASGSEDEQKDKVDPSQAFDDLRKPETDER